MDRPVTVRMSSLLLAVVVALALAVAYLIGAVNGGGSGAANAAETDATLEGGSGTVRMVGRGEVSAVPDMLTFSLSVTVKRTDLDSALADSSATMKRVLDKLADYGVEKGDVQTTGLSMDPEYAYHESSPPTLTGYRVTQRARVEVRTLSKAGAAITAAVDAGGNDVRVRGIRLQVSDPEKALAEARDAAIDQAKTKAEQYAGAAGQELGTVQKIRELSVSAPVSRDLSYRTAADSAGMKVPIRAGESDLSVRVEVIWSLG